MLFGIEKSTVLWFTLTLSKLCFVSECYTYIVQWWNLLKFYLVLPSCMVLSSKIYHHWSFWYVPRFCHNVNINCITINNHVFWLEMKFYWLDWNINISILFIIFFLLSCCDVHFLKFLDKQCFVIQIMVILCVRTLK